jgi:hypothetical protein
VCWGLSCRGKKCYSISVAKFLIKTVDSVLVMCKISVVIISPLRQF